MVKSSSPNAPSTRLIFLCPRTHASPQTCNLSASSILPVGISCCVIAVFVFRKQQEDWKIWWIPTVDWYFVTNKIFSLHVTYRYIHMIFIVKCVTITRFLIAYEALWWKSVIFIVLSSLETLHGTVQYRYCIFSMLYLLLRVRLKPQNPLLSCVRGRERERERE